MSGPKISIYDLTPEARKNLREQLKCDRRGMVCAQQIGELLQEIADSHFELEDLLAALRAAGAAQEVSEDLEKLEAGFAEELAEMRALLQENKLKATAKYTLTEEVLAGKRVKLAGLESLKARAQTYRAEVQRLIGQGNGQKAASVQAAETEIGKELGGVISFEVERPTEKMLFAQEKNAQTKRLQALAQNVPGSMKRDVMNALAAIARVGSMQALRTFTGLTVDTLEKRCAEEKARIAEMQAEFAELRLRYTSLCEQMDEPTREIPFTEAGIKALRSEIHALEQMLVRRCEQAYISACVDEVMAEMGYDLIGAREVTKRSGRRFRNELFTFEEGTAVNVTYADDGQISMELGGVAREDRIPTAAETEMLREDMESFCEDFAEVERRLQKKGVLLGRRISMAPPSGEYAAIINVNDYDVKADKEIAEIRAVGRKRKVSGRKTMKRSEN